MKCYNHNDRDAFGIDFTSGKALCLECMDTHKGMIIEKGNEESKTNAELIKMSYEQIKRNEKIMAYNDKVINFTENSMKYGKMPIIFLGMLSIITGVCTYLFAHNAIFGFALIVFGILLLSHGKTIKPNH
ncbi:hypothetical protein IKA15_05840 [bacterium]|nr:hypothetical protein [bacterium]